VRITQLELFAVPPRWLFLQVSTDEGIAGWGEPIVEGRVATVRAAVEELGEMLAGRDPFRIEDHFQVMWRGGFYRGGPVLSSAMSGIEQALGDIKGKALGVPAWELLDACTPNAVIQELSLRMHYNEGADVLDYVVDGSPFDIVDGHMAVPAGPGLGVEIDEERVRAAAGAEPWHSPVWRNDDGTVAEW
jgi:L-alanine-DL-glutamate epimerase-like enolase superfamily enzyme